MLKRLSSPRLEEPLASVGLLVLRLGVGGSMLFAHGLGKLHDQEGFTKFILQRLSAPASAELAMLATLTEVVGGALIMLGFFTRVAAIPLVLEMLVAAGFVHAMDPWSERERAVLYLLAFASLMGTGAGKFSLDALRERKRVPGEPISPAPADR